MYEYICAECNDELLAKVDKVLVEYRGRTKYLLQHGRASHILKKMGLRLSQIGGQAQCVAALFMLIGMVRAKHYLIHGPDVEAVDPPIVEEPERVEMPPELVDGGGEAPEPIAAPLAFTGGESPVSGGKLFRRRGRPPKAR